MRAHTPAQYLGNSPRRRRGRILLLVALALAVLTSLLMLGNLLHRRMETAAPLLALPAISYGELAASPATQTFRPYTAAKSYPGILCATEGDVLAKPEGLAAYTAAVREMYDGISVSLGDGEGHLFSSSVTPEEEAAYPRSVLDALLSTAKEAGLSVCAVWDGTVPAVDSPDGMAVIELCRSGFTEILFTPLPADGLGERDLAAALALSEALKTASPRLRVGFALEYETFFDVDAARTIEQLASLVDFLAVEIGAPPSPDSDGTEHATAQCAALYGSIPYYPLRVTVRGSAPQWTAQLHILRQSGYPALQAIGDSRQ